MNILNDFYICFRDDSRLIPDFYAISADDTNKDIIKSMISDCTSIKELICKMEAKSCYCRIWRIDEITHMGIFDKSEPESKKEGNI